MRHPTELHTGDIIWPQIKLLVFSPDDAFRFLARQTFRKLKVKDVLSTSVPEDAEHLAGYGPDIALVDFDGDGHAALAFLTRLRAAPNLDIPVLVLVKNADRPAIAPAFHVGIEGVVPKPVSGHELTIRVTETLREPQRMPVPNTPSQPVHKPVYVSSEANAAPPVPPEAKAFALTGKPGSAPASAAPKPAASGTVAEAAPRPASNNSSAASRPAAAGGSVSSGASRPAAGGNAHSSAAAIRPAGNGVPVAPRPSGGTLAGDDLKPIALKKPSGGKLDADDVPAVPKPVAIEVREKLAAPAPAQYRLEAKDDEAATAKAAARKAAWEAELAQRGHKKRKGSDVAELDVSAILDAHLTWLSTNGAEGGRANFQGMDLAGADISRAVLANASFREADLSDSFLAESRLDGCDFRYAKLGAANLAGVNLGVAQLRHADMRLTNLEGAVLRGADLSGARLRGAKLAGADFKGATMISTDLSEVDLSQVEGMSQAQADRTVCDMKTKMPPGISRPQKNE